MAVSGTDGPHVRESLGLYVVGALNGDERDRVELHLGQCVVCCLEADALGAAVVESLTLVPPEHLRHLMAEFGALAEQPHTGDRASRDGPR